MIFNIKLLGVAIVLIVSLFGAGYWYHKDTQKQLDVLKRNVAVLEQANRSYVETIKNLQIDQKKIQESNAKLQRELRAADAQVDKLRNKLIDHDLTVLSVRKPGLIQKRANDGTKQLFNDLRSITSN